MTIASYGLSEDYPVHAHVRRDLSPHQASGRLASFPLPEQPMQAEVVSRFKRIRDRALVVLCYTGGTALAAAAAYTFMNFPKH